MADTEAVSAKRNRKALKAKGDSDGRKHESTLVAHSTDGLCDYSQYFV